MLQTSLKREKNEEILRSYLKCERRRNTEPSASFLTKKNSYNISSMHFYKLIHTYERIFKKSLMNHDDKI